MLHRPETRSTMPPPDPDWRAIAFSDPYALAAGPWYWRLEDGRMMVGMRIDERHVSIRGVCHGGVIMTMADMMSLPSGYAAGLTDRLVPTMTFTMDFIGPAKNGDWLEMRTDLLKRTTKTLFTQAVIRTRSGDMVARSSATYRILSLPDEHSRILDRVLGLDVGV